MPRRIDGTSAKPSTRGVSRAADVRAVTPCSLYELERADLEAMMAKSPSIRASLEAADQQRRQELARLEASHTDP